MVHNVHHFTLATNLSKLSPVLFQINTSQNQSWKLLIRSTYANLHGCFTNTWVSRDNSVLSKSNKQTNQAYCSIQHPNIPHKPVAEMHTQPRTKMQHKIVSTFTHIFPLAKDLSLSLTHTNTHTHMHNPACYWTGCRKPRFLSNIHSILLPPETTLSEKHTLHFVSTHLCNSSTL